MVRKGWQGRCRVQAWKSFTFLLIASIAAHVFFGVTFVYGEGSVSLNPSGATGIRHYLPDQPSFAPANIPSTTTFFVYASQGETINLGSSANGVRNGRINYRPPTGGAFTQCLITGTPVTGRIVDRAQELAGPLPTSGGYPPCTVSVVAGQDGLWEITFTAPTTDGSTPAQFSEGANATWTAQATTDGHIKAWDITVRDSGGTAKPGRAFTNILGASNGSGNLQSRTFIQTVDGYRYRWRLNGVTPGTAALLSNAEGFTSGGARLFRSIQLAGTINPGALPAGIQIGTLPSSPTPTNYLAGLHKIFLNPPDTTLPASAASARGNTWLLVPAVVVGQVTNLTFTGIEGTPNQTGAGTLSGVFQATINGPGTIIVRLDLNSNGVFTDTIDRILSLTVTAAGTYTIPWDGNTGLGTPVAPTDGAVLLSFQSTTAVTGGEVHFPMLDFEGNTSGTIIERLDLLSNNPIAGGDTVFFDDRVIQANNPGGNGGSCGADANNSTNPLEAIAGIASAAGATPGAHKWTNNYGNCRGMDTWSLLSTPSTNVPLSIRVPQADLEVVSKTHSPATLTVGGPVTYTIVVRNNGVSDTTATVHDVFPPEITGLTVVSCTPTTGATCGVSSFTGNTFLGNVTLNVNAPTTPTSSVTYVISGTISALPAGGTLVNVAGIQRAADVFDPTATNPNPTPPVASLQGVRDECNLTIPGSGNGTTPACNNLRGDTAVISPGADMQATVSGFPASTTVGSPVNGTVTCTNNGPSPAANATCDVTGVPASATVLCSPTQPVNPLAVGNSIVCNVSFTAPASGDVTVTGTADTSTPDPNPNNDVASQLTVVGPAADVVATVNGFPASVTAGDTVTGTVTCRNDGPSPAANVTCDISGIPAGAAIACTPTPPVASLAVGATILCTVSYVAPAGGNVTATGTAATSTPDVNPSNNSDSRTTAVGPAANMAAVVTVPPTANAGTTVNGTVTCTNTGPSPAATATCNVTGLPTGAMVTCTPPSPVNPLLAGDSIVCSVSYTAPPSGTVMVTGTAVSGTPDPDPSDNNADGTTVVGPVADMSVQVLGFPTSVTAGTGVSGTVVCMNNGPSPAANVTCDVGGVPAGATVTCTPTPPVGSLPIGGSIACSVSYTAPGTGDVTVTGVTSTATQDPEPANNTDTLTTVVGPAADLQAVVSGFPTSANAGGTVTGTVTCTNNGPSPATNVTCEVTGLPAGATVACTPAQPVATLTAGASITCNVSYPTPPDGQVTVTGTIDSSTPTDPDPSNNTSSQPTQIGPVADMQAVVSGFPPTVNAGSPVSGTVTCTNNGPSAAAAATCNISGLPAGATVTCNPAPPVDSLAAGASITCNVSYTAPATDQVTIAGVTGSATPDLTPENNTNQQTTVVGPVANLAATVSGFPASVTEGDPVSGIVTCTNNGPSPAVDATCAVSGIPPGATVSCLPTPPVNPLGLGVSITCSVIYTAPASGSVTVTGVVSSATPDLTPDDNIASQTTLVGAAADMVAQVQGFPTSVTAGTIVSGTAVCTNNGPSTAGNATCNVSGAPAGATITCTPPSPVTALAVGSSITCSISYTAPAGGSVTVTAVTSTDTSDPNPTNNTDSQTTVVGPAADLQTVVSGFPTSITAGSPVTGTVTCTNNGPSPATDVTCAVTGLPPGATVVCTPPPPVNPLAAGASISCIVSFTAPASGQVVVTATTTSSTPVDPDPSNNTDNQPLLVGPVADMQSVVSGFPASITAGSPVTGTVICTNNGPSAAINATCTVTGVPSGATIACTPTPPVNPLASGASITCTVSYTAPASGSVKVTGVAGSATPDLIPDNNTAQQTTSVGAVADLAVTVSGFPATAQPGATVTGTVTCTNNGPSPATNPTCVVSGVPAGTTITCTPTPSPNPLPVGTSITCTVSYTAPASGSVTVTGVASSGTPDLIFVNNSASQTTGVGGGGTGTADMVATVSGFPPTAQPGATVTGTVTCTNNGPSPAANPTCVVSGVPAGTTITCTPTPPPNPLPVGASITCSVQFVMPASGNVGVRVEAGSTTGDPRSFNNLRVAPVFGPETGPPGPPPSPPTAGIPTLSEWGLVALVCVLLGLGVRRLQKQASNR